MADKTEVQSIRELDVLAQSQPKIMKTDDGREFAFVPTGNGGYKMEQITAANAAPINLPKIVSHFVKLQTASSLVDYVNRFKNDDTAMFADINNNTITAIIDYHRGSDDLLKPQLAAHRASLVLPFSQEFSTWSRESGKLMSHVDFASFLEENSIDIVTPVGADLLEICRDLQVKSGFNVNTSVRSGDYTHIEFQKGDDVSTKDNMQLPVSITIEIPIYFGERAVQINAFLRRKIVDQKLHLGYVLNRVESARQAEFHRIVSNVSDATASAEKLTTVYGTAL